MRRAVEKIVDVGQHGGCVPPREALARGQRVVPVGALDLPLVYPTSLLADSRPVDRADGHDPLDSGEARQVAELEGFGAHKAGNSDPAILQLSHQPRCLRGRSGGVRHTQDHLVTGGKQRVHPSPQMLGCGQTPLRTRSRGGSTRGLRIARRAGDEGQVVRHGCQG